MPQNSAKITEFTGTVQIKRIDQPNWRQVNVGTQINFGDMLKKQPGASVKVRCGDGRAGSSLPNGVAKGLPFICPTVFRNASDPAIPYTISPRDTLILTKQPTLRWHAPNDANRFEVIVRGQEVNWTKQVSREEACQGDVCELVYPGDQPLQPGVSYKLVIETTDTNRSSEEITEPGLGFKLIDEDKALEIQNIAQEIKQQEFSAVEKALKLADMYNEKLLTAEAIATLEALPDEDKNTTVYYQLGQLYHSIKLPSEAKAYYEKAIAKAEVTGNKSELAVAQVGLGEANWTLGKQEEARRLLETAKAIYTELGDIDMVSYLEERLREMVQ
ncbi:hypothetical protein B4U84_19525 [Westiellopsis prolifica IICB1]|nr:hypothetical protein B4U84_19525 [Westiellopsis prolifica IICB1]